MKQFGFTMECLLSLLISVPAESSSNHTGYSDPNLPPLLELLDGTPVHTLEDWVKRKEEIRRLLCQYFIGAFPTTVPAIIDTEVLNEIKKDDGSIRRRVKLTFDTQNKASFEMWVWIPQNKEAFPILPNERKTATRILGLWELAILVTAGRISASCLLVRESIRRACSEGGCFGSWRMSC